MVILFNLLPFFFVIAVALALYLVKNNKVRVWIVVVSLILAVIFSTLRPSMGYKGEIKRTMLEPMEAPALEVQDRNRKPIDGSVYDQRRTEEYKLGPEFLREHD